MNVENRSEIIPACEAFFVELNKSLRSISMYPSGHPLLKKTSEQTYIVFRNFVNRVGEFTITIGKQSIFFNDVPFGKENEIIIKFSHDLALKNIHKLTFTPDLTVEEFHSFLELLRLDETKIRQLGGIHKLFQEKNIIHLNVKELEYEKLLNELAAEQEDEVEPSESLAPPPAPADEPPPMIAEIIEEAPKVDQELENELFGYLRLLSSENSIDRYKKIIVDLIRFVEDLQNEGHNNLAFEALLGLAREMIPQKKRTPEFISLCQRAIKKLSLPEIISDLVNRFSDREIKNRAELSMLFKAIGHPTISPLLERLIESTDSSIRRNLIQLLVNLGDLARPKIEIFLFDERWYVVRNMAMILGDIKNEKSLNSLSRVINHKDIRVQREVIHSLTKIGGKHIAPFFLHILGEVSPQLSLIIINSLGILGDPIATEPLISIVQKRDFFYRNYEIRKQAIISLGMIRAKEAVEPLGKLLLKGEFLGGIRNEDLRITAARSLARIGGEKAIAMLHLATNKRNYSIRKAAEASLATMGFGNESLRR